LDARDGSRTDVIRRIFVGFQIVFMVRH